MMESRVIPWSVCVMNEWRERCCPLWGTIFQCERQDEMTLQEVIETFAPETRLSLCRGGWCQICLIQTWSFSPSSLYGRFMNVWSYCSGDKAFYAGMHLRRKWWCTRSGWKGQSMKSWGHDLFREEQSNSEHGCEHVRGGCGRRDPTRQLFNVSSLSQSFSL